MRTRATSQEEEQPMNETSPHTVRVRIRRRGQEGFEEVPVPEGESPVRAGLQALRKKEPPLVGDGWYVIEQKA